MPWLKRSNLSKEKEEKGHNLSEIQGIRNEPG